MLKQKLFLFSLTSCLSSFISPRGDHIGFLMMCLSGSVI